MVMACTINNDKQHMYAALLGKWFFTQQYRSDGSMGQWYPIQKHNQWIELKNNGVFSSNFAPFESATRYEIKDSIHIKLYEPLRSDSLCDFYKVDSIQHILTFSPTIYICVEGCAKKFEKNHFLINIYL